MGLKQDLVYRLAKRWISGKEMNGAIAGAREVNGKGIGAILNYLGEDVVDLDVAQRHFQEYKGLQQEISKGGLDACVSIKLTQFGLASSEEFAVRRAESLAETAERSNQIMWIDMEGSKYTSKTLDIYLGLLEKHKNVGVALQAYLRRSETDLRKLIEKGARIRLVKGAYREPPDIVYKSRDGVSRNFSKLMLLLFDGANNFAIATHDSKLIEEAKGLAEKRHAAFEFGMLKGIRDPLKLELSRSGYRMVDYIPYGAEWYSYSMRRIKEHPSNIWLLLRSLF